MTTPHQPEPLTEVEQLKLRVLRLEGQLLDRAVLDWTAKADALKAEFEASRDGWEFVRDTGQWRFIGGSDAPATTGTD